MKIIGGSLRGRALTQPKATTVRPLSDKVRAAIFDVTGVPPDALVLDAYAGSGAAGFEALSRGAAMVEAIEGDPRVARVIERNARELDLQWGHLLHVMKVETWLALPANQPSSQQPLQRYDLIIADPPYARLDPDIIGRLAAFLTSTGVLVLSHASKQLSPQLITAQLIQAKTYGDTSVSYYRRH